MTSSHLSFAVAPTVASDGPAQAPSIPLPSPVVTPVADPVTDRPAAAVGSAPTDDNVLLPRHLADAAYHVLQAVHALKDNAGLDLFRALGQAMNKGGEHVAVSIPGCDNCHVEVGQGFPHHPECWSEEAQRYRALTVPQPAPLA